MCSNETLHLWPPPNPTPSVISSSFRRCGEADNCWMLQPWGAERVRARDRDRESERESTTPHSCRLLE